MFTNEHLVIAGLVIAGLYLYQRSHTLEAKSRELHNEEILRWTDYRGHNYEVQINRKVHE